MLCDNRRMVAYHRAILGNASCFKGKTVLDVGTGTGILALWCAKAGAAKVYCVEYTGMAKLAKNLLTANGTLLLPPPSPCLSKLLKLYFYSDFYCLLRRFCEGYGDVCEVMQCSVEDLELEHQVDILVSEWMGYMLLRESMLDSLVRARDKWLKPRGLMFPSHATIEWGIVSDEVCGVAFALRHL